MAFDRKAQNLKKIEVGDVVKMTSHPEFKMTVFSVDSNSVKCAWFDNDKSLRIHDFPIQTVYVANKSMQRLK
ncbi:hypothetical protein WSM22_34560 [Cytophagales bacterium WSM2-2]|nr:hypothetical protein WSM22_34560 [Cytophagales bacterium WSM2-2]